MQDYHGLRVWKKAQAQAINIERLTRGFPRRGYSSIKGQMIRAAESVVNNIVEGCGAATPKDFARFLDMSIKSSSELQNEVETAHGYGIVADRESKLVIEEVQDVRKMTWGLRKRVLGE
jgi:four helix bundle protein